MAFVSYHIKEVIKKTARNCAIAAVPGAFVPGLDMAVVGSFWLYMMTEIANEHNITFDEEPIKFIGTVAAGVGAYWTGSRIINRVLMGILLIFAPFAFVIAAPLLNVFLNAFFTWSVGRRMNDIFAANDNSKAGKEIAYQIVRAVCHLPSRSEISDFFDETSISLSWLKDLFS